VQLGDRRVSDSNRVHRGETLRVAVTVAVTFDRVGSLVDELWLAQIARSPQGHSERLMT